MNCEKKSRRKFLESVALGIAGAGAIPSLPKSEARAAAGEMTYRTLGRSGEKVSMHGLVQFHEVIRMSDPDRIFGPNGAFEAAQAAKKAGKIRYIGFTGHKDPDIHLKMLNTGLAHGFTFDTVQMPLNIMDAHYHSF